MSHAADSGADTHQLKKLFHSQAQVFGATYRRGEAKLDVDPIQTFIRNVSKKNVQGFYECEIARETKVYEHFAHVYSDLSGIHMKHLITSLSLCGLAFGSLFSSASVAKEDELEKPSRKSGKPCRMLPIPVRTPIN